MSVEPLFTMTVGFNTESETYGAIISTAAGQHATMEHAELSHLLFKARELMLTKAAEIQGLPQEEEMEDGTIRIVTPADFRPPLVGPDGKVFNGHS